MYTMHLIQTDHVQSHIQINDHSFGGWNCIYKYKTIRHLILLKQYRKTFFKTNFSGE